MSLDIYKFDESILGVSSWSASFCVCESILTCRRKFNSVDPSKKLELFDELMLSEGKKQDKRCLYIHIPFCRVRCTFCNFFQMPQAAN